MESFSRPLYEHDQVAWIARVLAMVGVVIAVVVLQQLPDEQGRIAISIAAAAVGLAGTTTSRMKIQVFRDSVACRFGIPFFRKSIALDTIAEATPSTVSWLAGTGIHRTRRGWLYNVWGRDIVLITLKDGRAILLGTDEPALLTQAITQAIKQRKGSR